MSKKKRNVLVVVDYQNDFVDGSLGFKGAELLDKGISNRIKEFLDRGDLVVFTKDTHNKNYLETQEGKFLPIEHCIYGTEGHNLYGKTGGWESKEGTAVVEKPTFGSETLGYVINYNLDADLGYIEMCGLVTNICVISNAIVLQTYFENPKIKINSKLCASNDIKMHEAALSVMKGLGMEII